MNTIQQVARQAADDAVVNHCNLGDVDPEIRRDMADAVAVAVLNWLAQRPQLQKLSEAPVSALSEWAAFTPAEPPQSKICDTCWRLQEKLTRNETEHLRAMASVQRHVDYLEGTAIPHARKQEHANGFQAGWHSAIDRFREGDTSDELRALVPDSRQSVAPAEPQTPEPATFDVDHCRGDNVTGACDYDGCPTRTSGPCPLPWHRPGSACDCTPASLAALKMACAIPVSSARPARTLADEAWQLGEMQRLKTSYQCARAAWAAEVNAPDPAPFHHEKVQRLHAEMESALDALLSGGAPHGQ